MPTEVALIAGSATDGDSSQEGVGVPCWWFPVDGCRAVPATWFSVPKTILVKSFSTRFSSLRVIGAVNMSSSDKIPPVLALAPRLCLRVRLRGVSTREMWVCPVGGCRAVPATWFLFLQRI